MDCSPGFDQQIAKQRDTTKPLSSRKQGSQVFVEISYPSEFLDQVRVEGYPKLLWVSDEELD
jgi:hypothetical protein